MYHITKVEVAQYDSPGEPLYGFIYTQNDDQTYESGPLFIANEFHAIMTFFQNEEHRIAVDAEEKNV